MNTRPAGLCQVEGVEKCRVCVLSVVCVFFLLFHDVVLVAECGQTEASKTMEKLKELPVDVYHELMQAWVKALLN